MAFQSTTDGTKRWRFTPNTCRVQDECAYIDLPNRSNEPTETVIDRESLPVVLAYGRWHRVWSPSTRSYYAVCVNRGAGLHRVITGAPLGLDVDHVNHDTLDNRLSNLVVCTHVENMKNRHPSRPREPGRSGVKGVYWHSKVSKWYGQVVANGRTHSCGIHDTIAEAAVAVALTRERLGLTSEPAELT